MAFTATINSISASDTPSGVQYLVIVTFADEATDWSTIRNFLFPINTTQAVAVAKIRADGTVIKNALAAISDLRDKVGTVLTI